MDSWGRVKFIGLCASYLLCHVIFVFALGTLALYLRLRVSRSSFISISTQTLLSIKYSFLRAFSDSRSVYLTVYSDQMFAVERIT